MALIEGLILTTRSYRDNDLLVRVFTKEEGILTVMARGAKKPKSKVGYACQPYTWLIFDGAYPKNGAGLGFMNGVQESKSYRHVIQDINVSAYAALIAKLLDLAFEENQPQTSWYQKAVAGFEKLDAGIDPQIITNIFELQLLPAFGVAPNWQADPISGAVTGDFDYSEKYNGIIDRSHFDLDDHRLNLEPKTVYYLRQFSAIDIEKISKVTLSLMTKRAIQRVIDYLYDRELGLKPKEKVFIQKMAAWEGQLAIKARKGKS
ncbi:DNA repair protein RecO [Fructobacillus pseudoficulneus]|uniref:DNA repair protein RecO n=1 Tax=Fructobacillus pseudoficulneus TaxID=220714 RepID=A0A3F3H0D3_9LACO|nr:DNA repair protein RecO [Fructobacillus pseudoficulneus]GAP02148.1 DNA repair protein RecO [Fructobacillus pseudoficulneus]SEH35896.1 DNA replication and repair protein RecO [Fructobacillus pseudoficulneus]